MSQLAEACLGSLFKWCSLISHWLEQVRPETSGEVPSAHHEAMAMAGTFISITKREQRIENSNATHHSLLMFEVIFLMSLLITPALLASSEPFGIACLGLSPETYSHLS